MKNPVQGQRNTCLIFLRIGNAGDSLDTKNGWSANDMAFTTKDRDNDQNGGNCGATERGGWWYRSCQAANLNGIYNGPNVKGINWYYYKMNRDSFRRSEMKFRPIDFEGCQQKTENRKPKLPWVPRFGK